MKLEANLNTILKMGAAISMIAGGIWWVCPMSKHNELRAEVQGMKVEFVEKSLRQRIWDYESRYNCDDKRSCMAKMPSGKLRKYLELIAEWEDLTGKTWD